MSKRKSKKDEENTSVKKRKTGEGDEDASNESTSDSFNLSQNPDFINLDKEAEVGIIEKVSMKNFMCHSRLEVNLGPHVNFIVGRNGSGKSAVVTALVVGLGGKASVTSRGSSLKSFIKTGKRTAEVEIRLRNKGPEAYKPHLYGDSIIVLRKLLAEGGSKYELRSKEGKLVSDKREELSHILDQFNIQVDNPIAILNQDTSRNFLHSKNPQDKYKFFLKATQLEQMKNDYAIVKEQKGITIDTIEHKTKTLPVLEKEVLKWEEKFKAFSAIDKLKDKVKLLKNEMAWAIVADKEKGLEPIEKKIKEEESKLPKLQTKAEKMKNKIKELVQTKKEADSRVFAISEQVKEIEPDLKNKKKRVQESKDLVRQAHNVLRKNEGDLKSAQRDRELVMRRIEEIKSMSQTDYESERQERLSAIEKLRKNLDEMKAKEKSTSHDREQFLNATTHLKNESYTLNQEEQRIRMKLDQSKRKLNELISSRKDRFQRFGKSVPNILNKIEEYHRRGMFHEKPKGPLGACFKLMDHKWALATESCLKGLILSFCCHDYHDEKKLEEIFSSQCEPNCQRTSIITCQFRNRVHDVSKYRVQCEKYPSLLDIIKTDDPVVANTLIEQRGIENIILIADNREARQYMEKNPPPRCKEAFTLAGDQIYCSPIFRYYSSNKDKAHILTADVEADIKGFKEEVRCLEADNNQIRQRKQEMDEEIRKNQRQEKQCETQLMKIMEAINTTNLKIRELLNVEDPTPVDASALEGEVQEYEQQIQILEEKYEEAKTKYHEKQESLKQAETEYREQQELVKAKMAEIEPHKTESSSIDVDISLARKNSKRYEDMLKTQEKAVKDLLEEKTSFLKELQVFVKKATDFCPERVVTKRSPQTLQSEIYQINKTIKNEEKHRGNYEEITVKYKETSDAFKKINGEVSCLKRFIELMEEVMRNRKKQYIQLRKYIALSTKYFFITLLGNRNYSGKMMFSHPDETLEVLVIPDANAGSSQDPKALSGGERSFSTVCFILALWEAMESPFRCLDEFDVFMDMVNRRVSMNLMMDTARQQTRRQFIFLTPQDMSHLNITNNFRVFRMPNPDRGQKTLTFGQRGDGNMEEEEEEN